MMSVLEQGDAEVAGDMFEVDDMTLAFSGRPNVLAGDYLYVLNASSGMGDTAQQQSRKWKLEVTDRALPGAADNATDQREAEALYGAAGTVEDQQTEADATVGDFGGRVPAGFMVALDSAEPLVRNVPRLRLGVLDSATPPQPVGLTLDGEIHSVRMSTHSG